MFNTKAKKGFNPPEGGNVDVDCRYAYFRNEFQSPRGGNVVLKEKFIYEHYVSIPQRG